MLKNLMKKKKKSKGFTLIELIIVIAIIAILAAVAIPKYLEIKENGNRKADIANGKAILDATRTLIAEGKIDISTAYSSVIDSNATSYGEDIYHYLSDPQYNCKTKEIKDDKFKVYIETDGTVTVFSDASGGAPAHSEIEIAPNPDPTVFPNN